MSDPPVSTVDRSPATPAAPAFPEFERTELPEWALVRQDFDPTEIVDVRQVPEILATGRCELVEAPHPISFGPDWMFVDRLS